jgi:hypothetical protein
MSVQSFLHTIDGISTWVGKAAAWLMIVLMSVVCIEVFKRYIMNMPTSWIFDLDNMLYGSLFMLCSTSCSSCLASPRFVTPATTMPPTPGASPSIPTSPQTDRRSTISSQ